MNVTKYFAVSVFFGVQDREKIDEFNYEAMTNYECDGVEEGQFDELELDAILGEKSYCGGEVSDEILIQIEENNNLSNVKYFFYSTNALTKLNQFKEFLNKNLTDSTFKTEEFADQDWNESWREHYKEIKVTDDFSIIPSWEKGNSNSGVYIYPGMGFGTGEHETTFLCLKLFLEELKHKKFNQVLDFGCGSGILGIANSYLDNECKVDFFDIDYGALDNTAQNLEVNQIDRNNVNILSLKNLNFKKNYDLVYANILLPVLIEEKERIKSFLKNGSYLILSGILREQVVELKKHYQELSVIKEVYKNDWSAILFGK